jgi:hypothetical protein
MHKWIALKNLRPKGKKNCPRREGMVKKKSDELTAL